MSSADFTVYTPGIGTLSDKVSSPLGENSAHSSAGNAIHNFSNFSFHQVPITAGWVEAIWNEKFARHFYR